MTGNEGAGLQARPLLHVVEPPCFVAGVDAAGCGASYGWQVCVTLLPPTTMIVHGPFAVTLLLVPLPVSARLPRPFAVDVLSFPGPAPDRLLLPFAVAVLLSPTAATAMLPGPVCSGGVATANRCFRDAAGPSRPGNVWLRPRRRRADAQRGAALYDCDTVDRYAAVRVRCPAGRTGRQRDRAPRRSAP